MNERIKELSEQALESVSNKRMLKDGQLERTWDPHEYDQVFAELIVGKCIEVLNKRFMGDHNREDQEVRRCIKDLKNHFGVEE